MVGSLRREKQRSVGIWECIRKKGIYNSNEGKGTGLTGVKF